MTLRWTSPMNQPRPALPRSQIRNVDHLLVRQMVGELRGDDEVERPPGL